MTKRHDDAIYFGLILGVAAIAFLASEWTSNSKSDETSTHESADLEFPAIHSDFEFPRIELPELSFVVRPSSLPRAPRTPIWGSSDEIESALVNVRSVLLASSNPTEFVETE